MHNDVRVLRDRHEGLAFQADRLASVPPPDAGPLLVQTTTVSTYPTNGSSFFAVVQIDPDGVEAEGSPATYTTVGGIFFALNAGNALPPVGTKLIVEPINGRWIFYFKG